MNILSILRDDGKLNMKKGLIQIEGGANAAASGTTPEDFKDVPYLYFIEDYTGQNATAQTLVAAIKALGGTADYIKLDEEGWWQGKYAGPYGAGYVGPFAGVSHMMMIEDRNLQVMDVILKWTEKNIKNPKATACKEDFDED